MSEYHTPVLLDESVSALITNPSGIYVDVTFGGGGHTAEILSRLSPAGRVIAFDRDSDAIQNRIDDPRLILIRADFRYIHNFVMYAAHEGATGQQINTLAEDAKVDGVLADHGVSSHQFDTADRGFSFRFDAPLDMRMNTEAETTAADIINSYGQKDLERILKIYGEVDNARRIAQLIVAGSGRQANWTPPSSRHFRISRATKSSQKSTKLSESRSIMKCVHWKRCFQVPQNH